MKLKDVFKKGKLAITGVALGGALLTTGTGCSENGEVKETKDKTEQRSENKSEIRQKISYLDEYVAAIESGKNKEQAYREFALKMADGDAKKMENIQQQVEILQKESSIHKLCSIGSSITSTALFFVILPLITRDLKNHKARITALEQAKRQTKEGR